MTTISNTENYNILYDASKNRIYMELRGFWRDEAIGKQFIQDIDKLKPIVKPRFTMLVDAYEFLTQPQTIQSIVEQAQRIAMESGLLKMASIPPKSFIAKVQAESMSKKNAMPQGRFATIEEANTWLDEISQQK